MESHRRLTCYAAREVRNELAKASASLREMIDRLPADARLEVLVSVIGDGRAHAEALRALGFETHAMTGPIVSGVLSAGSLRALAGAPFVRRVDLSRALYAEPEEK